MKRVCLNVKFRNFVFLFFENRLVRVIMSLQEWHNFIFWLVQSFYGRKNGLRWGFQSTFRNCKFFLQKCSHCWEKLFIASIWGEKVLEEKLWCKTLIAWKKRSVTASTHNIHPLIAGCPFLNTKRNGMHLKFSKKRTKLRSSNFHRYF